LWAVVELFEVPDEVFEDVVLDFLVDEVLLEDFGGVA
jgi:hypothetical protein